MRNRTIVVWILSAALTAATTLAARPALAARPWQPALQAGGPDNQPCLACHSTPGLTTTLPSGEVLPVTVDPKAFDASAHGRAGYACVQCHTNISDFPHPEFTAQDRREATLQLYTTCRQCHEDKYELTLDSVHQRALASGNNNAAVCTDCHNPHIQARLTDPGTGQVLPIARVQIPQTCARCHNAIYEEYKQSVHGSALAGEGNPDVPTCIDCHGVHNVQGPISDSKFHLFSPQICARCHTDAAKMSKYGIRTDVVNNYVADFHGTTVTLFEKVTPDQQTNKPVCVDCHGFHNIKAVTDPEATVIKENLLATCRKCHPDATANFPAAWLSHYSPSPQHNPLVYYVQLFYKIFIPAVIGGMALFVLSDIGRRAIERRRAAARS